MHIEWYLWNFYQSYHCNRNLKINYFSIAIIHNFFYLSLAGWSPGLSLFNELKALGEDKHNECKSILQLKLLSCLLSRKCSPAIAAGLVRRNSGSTEIKRKASFDVSGDRITSWCLPPWMLILTLRRNVFTSVLKAELCSIYYRLSAPQQSTTFSFSANSGCK